MTASVAPLLLSALAGAVLASLYLGVLWVSLRWMPSDARAPLWILVSGVARLVFVVAGFWLVSGGRGPALAAAFVGFLVLRTLGVGLARARIGRGAAPGAVGSPEA